MAELGTELLFLVWRGDVFTAESTLYVGGVFWFVSYGAYSGDGGLLFVVLYATMYVILLGGLFLT
jgi:hypothetical protein